MKPRHYTKQNRRDSVPEYVFVIIFIHLFSASRVKKKNCAPEFSNLNTMCLNAATNCIAKQRKRIRCLQQQLRRAHKEIENLRETLIDVLEKKLLAPDEDHDF